MDFEMILIYIMFLIVIIMILYTCRENIKAVIDYVKCKDKVQATVYYWDTSEHKGKGGKMRYHNFCYLMQFTYEYKGEYITSEEMEVKYVPPKGNIEYHYVGDNLEVYVNPNNPYQAIIKNRHMTKVMFNKIADIIMYSLLYIAIVCFLFLNIILENALY